MKPSDSIEQQTAEAFLLNAVNRSHFVTMIATRYAVAQGVYVDLDGYDENQCVACEIYARVGDIKGAQPKKIATDMLKLMLVEKVLGKPLRKLVVVASSQAHATFTGKAWMAEAARQFGVEIVLVELSDDVRERIQAAQARQKMVNAS